MAKEERVLPVNIRDGSYDSHGIFTGVLFSSQLYWPWWYRFIKNTRHGQRAEIHSTSPRNSALSFSLSLPTAHLGFAFSLSVFHNVRIKKSHPISETLNNQIDPTGHGLAVDIPFTKLWKKMIQLWKRTWNLEWLDFPTVSSRQPDRKIGKKILSAY